MRRVSSVVLVLVLIACGGASDSSDQTTTTASTASTTATTQGETNTGTDGLPSADCVQLSLTLSQASALGIGTATGDPSDTVLAFENMAAAAPAEIADDLEVLAAAYGEFLAELEDAGVDIADPTTYGSPEAQAAMAAASEALNTAGVAEASANISAYVDSVCQ